MSRNQSKIDYYNGVKILVTLLTFVNSKITLSLSSCSVRFGNSSKFCKMPKETCQTNISHKSDAYRSALFQEKSKLFKVNLNCTLQLSDQDCRLCPCSMKWLTKMEAQSRSILVFIPSNRQKSSILCDYYSNNILLRSLDVKIEICICEWLRY